MENYLASISTICLSFVPLEFYLYLLKAVLKKKWRYNRSHIPII